MSITIATLNAMLAEQTRQDAQWGGREHDAAHTIEEWQEYLHAHTTRLATDPDPKQRLIKIAAMALQAAEVQPYQYAACYDEYIAIGSTHEEAIKRLGEDKLSYDATWYFPEDSPKSYEVTTHLTREHRWGDVRDQAPWCDMDEVPEYDDVDVIVYEPTTQLRKETIVLTYDARYDEWEVAR